MASPFPGSAVFLDLPFPIEPDEYDYEDTRIIVIKKDPLVSPLKNIVVNLKESIAPTQFQRPESWTPKEKKKFWLSLLMNRIEGVIVVVDIQAALHRVEQLNPSDRAVGIYKHLLEKGYEFIILDGNNRLKFLLALLSDEWAIPEGKYEYIRDLQDSSTSPFKVTRKKNKFSDLPQAVQTTLRNRCCIISEYTQIGYAGLSDVFTNTNAGVFPNPQEIRNASKSLWSDFVRHLDQSLRTSGLMGKMFTDPLKRYCGQDWITECLDFALNSIEINEEENDEFFPISQSSKTRLYGSTFLTKEDQKFYIETFNNLSQYITQMIENKVLDEKSLKRKTTVQNLFWMLCNGILTYDQAVEAVKLHEKEYLRKDKFFTDVKEFAENQEVVGEDLTFKNSCEGSRSINIEHRYLILSEIVAKVKKEFYSDVSGIMVGSETL